MGLVQAPKIEHCWSKKEIHNYSFIRYRMFSDKFQLLLNMLHFNENEVVDQQNRLHKIHPLIDSVSQSCKSVYTPGSSVVIAESLIPFRGRVNIRQYIPGKVNKYEIKLFKLCTPNLCTWNFQVYSGNIAKEPTFMHLESVVLQLSRPLLLQRLTIKADNFYLSVSLAKKLSQEKCTTVELCRKIEKHCLSALQGQS
jgi:hypothetical protein